MTAHVRETKWAAYEPVANMTVSEQIYVSDMCCHLRLKIQTQAVFNLTAMATLEIIYKQETENTFESREEVI